MVRDFSCFLYLCSDCSCLHLRSFGHLFRLGEGILGDNITSYAATARVETKMLKEGMARKGWRGRRDKEIVVKARTGVKVAIGSNTRLTVTDFSLMSAWFPGRRSSDVWIPEEEGQGKVGRK